MRHHVHLPCAFFVLFAALSGCSKHTKLALPPDSTAQRIGQVEHVIAPVDDDKRYKPIVGMTFVPAAPLDNRKPIYPASLLSKRLSPVSVSVEIIVDAQGAVTSVKPVNNEGVPQEFIDETVGAVGTWAFAPLEQFDGEKYEPLPYSETYVFEFTQIDGQPVVK